MISTRHTTPQTLDTSHLMRSISRLFLTHKDTAARKWRMAMYVTHKRMEWVDFRKKGRCGYSLTCSLLAASANGV